MVRNIGIGDQILAAEPVDWSREKRKCSIITSPSSNITELISSLDEELDAQKEVHYFTSDTCLATGLQEGGAAAHDDWHHCAARRAGGGGTRSRHL